MIVITHNRRPCIGCNYCVEVAPHRWRMSKGDGKVVLANSQNKKGFFTARVGDEEKEEALIAAEVCPMNIIQVKEV